MTAEKELATAQELGEQRNGQVIRFLDVYDIVPLAEERGQRGESKRKPLQEFEPSRGTIEEGDARQTRPGNVCEGLDAGSGRKMKVMLVFPPDWYPSEPYLSLPTLTCVLRAAEVGDGPGDAPGTIKPQSVYASWGDYYFMEALSRRLHRTTGWW